MQPLTRRADRFVQRLFSPRLGSQTTPPPESRQNLLLMLRKKRSTLDRIREKI